MFSNEQVRIILFRECDFRGRKLLFDSHSVQKVPILDATQPNGTTAVTKVCDKYVEVADGFGYVVSTDFVLFKKTIKKFVKK